MDLYLQYWWLYAFITSVFAAIYYTINQYANLPGYTLVFWRGFIPLITLTPLLFFLEWPNNHTFYIATITTSLIVTYTDARVLQGVAIFGGGVSLRMKPFSVWLIFLLWFCTHADHRNDLLSDPLKFICILMTLCVGAYAASNLRKCNISNKAFFYFLPIILSSALIDVLNKTAMDHSGLMSGVIIYAWIQALIISVFTAAHHVINKNLLVKDIFNSKTVLTGIFLGLCVVVMNISKNIAMSYTVNPAYVTAIVFIAPFWVSLFYKITKYEEEADVRSGAILVLSSIALVLLNK
jgi:hypothetical protein